MKTIRDALSDMTGMDSLFFTADGRFDKRTDINKLWAKYCTNKITRPEFLRRYADILERD